MSVSVPPPVSIAINKNGAHEHYEGVMRDLGRQLARLDLERQRIKSLMESLSSFLPDHGDNGSLGAHVEQGKGVREFAGIPLLEAVRRYLEREGSPQSASAIVQALRRGGFPSSSRDFAKVVVPALYRHVKRTNGTPKSCIRKFGTEWGLVVWEKIGGQQ